ncbi:MAG TPA: hypothetical protein VHW47_04920, partial [Acidimicrobiales bacterium]|nr:hypothetical protein [Acidimicrobiales bacterium]
MLRHLLRNRHLLPAAVLVTVGLSGLFGMANTAGAATTATTVPSTTSLNGAGATTAGSPTAAATVTTSTAATTATATTATATSPTATSPTAAATATTSATGGLGATRSHFGVAATVLACRRSVDAISYPGGANAGSPKGSSFHICVNGQVTHYGNPAIVYHLPPNSDIKVGREMFEETCSSCHGAKAEGSDAAPPLV